MEPLKVTTYSQSDGLPCSGAARLKQMLQVKVGGNWNAGNMLIAIVIMVSTLHYPSLRSSMSPIFLWSMKMNFSGSKTRTAASWFVWKCFTKIRFAMGWDHMVFCVCDDASTVFFKRGKNGMGGKENENRGNAGITVRVRKQLNGQLTSHCQPEGCLHPLW